MDSKEIVRRQFDTQAQNFSSWSVTKNETYMQAYFGFIGSRKKASCWTLHVEPEISRFSVQKELKVLTA